MPKSKNRKNHKSKLADFKLKKKQEDERMRKVMYDKYMKAQEDYLASQEEHKDTEQEQEINIDTDDFTIDE